MNKRKIIELAGEWALKSSVFISLLFLVMFLVMILSKGAGIISWSFLTEMPKKGMTEGGIFPAIVGTLSLTILSMVIALPLGVLSAIFLSEYGKPEWLVSIIKISINTLSGTPSIVYGLFGLSVFVITFKMGVSILSGSLTLAVLILPIIINATVESIKGVPFDFREAAYSLGATKRQVILRVILPAAAPGILTGSIISVGRAAGETAPILFTAATFYTRKLPKSLFDEVMAMPYHIYALMTEGTAPDTQVPIAYGTAVVLLLLVLIVNGSAIFIRYRMRKRRMW
ncbi:MAG: phosphate ABC transporter permease PstA [bacterium]